MGVNAVLLQAAWTRNGQRVAQINPLGGRITTVYHSLGRVCGQIDPLGHRATMVFDGDGRRLPTNGPHLIWATDVGHIYDRKYRQSFDSRIFEWKTPVAAGLLTAQAQTPTGTRLELSVRSAATREEFAKQAWTVSSDKPVTVAAEHRFAQYRATIHSDNGDRYPVVERVEFVLKP